MTVTSPRHCSLLAQVVEQLGIVHSAGAATHLGTCRVGGWHMPAIRPSVALPYPSYPNLPRRDSQFAATVCDLRPHAAFSVRTSPVLLGGAATSGRTRWASVGFTRPGDGSSTGSSSRWLHIARGGSDEACPKQAAGGAGGGCGADGLASQASAQQPSGASSCGDDAAPAGVNRAQLADAGDGEAGGASGLRRLAAQRLDITAWTDDAFPDAAGSRDAAQGSRQARDLEANPTAAGAGAVGTPVEAGAAAASEGSAGQAPDLGTAWQGPWEPLEATAAAAIQAEVGTSAAETAEAMALENAPSKKAAPSRKASRKKAPPAEAGATPFAPHMTPALVDTRLHNRPQAVPPPPHLRSFEELLASIDQRYPQEGHWYERVKNSTAKQLLRLSSQETLTLEGYEARTIAALSEHLEAKGVFPEGKGNIAGAVEDVKRSQARQSKLRSLLQADPLFRVVESACGPGGARVDIHLGVFPHYRHCVPKVPILLDVAAAAAARRELLSQTKLERQQWVQRMEAEAAKLRATLVRIPAAPPPSLAYLLPAIDQRYPPSRSPEDWLRNRATKVLLRMSAGGEEQHALAVAGAHIQLAWLQESLPRAQARRRASPPPSLELIARVLRDGFEFSVSGGDDPIRLALRVSVLDPASYSITAAEAVLRSEGTPTAAGAAATAGVIAGADGRVAGDVAAGAGVDLLGQQQQRQQQQLLRSVPAAPPPSLAHLLPAIEQRYPPERSTEDWLRNTAARLLLRAQGLPEHQLRDLGSPGLLGIYLRQQWTAQRRGKNPVQDVGLFELFRQSTGFRVMRAPGAVQELSLRLDVARLDVARLLSPPPSLEHLLPAIDQRYPPSRSYKDWLRNQAARLVLSAPKPDSKYTLTGLMGRLRALQSDDQQFQHHPKLGFARMYSFLMSDPLFLPPAYVIPGTYPPPLLHLGELDPSLRGMSLAEAAAGAATAPDVAPGGPSVVGLEGKPRASSVSQEAATSSTATFGNEVVERGGTCSAVDVHTLGRVSFELGPAKGAAGTDADAGAVAEAMKRALVPGLQGSAAGLGTPAMVALPPAPARDERPAWLSASPPAAPSNGLSEEPGVATPSLERSGREVGEAVAAAQVPLEDSELSKVLSGSETAAAEVSEISKVLSWSETAAAEVSEISSVAASSSLSPEGQLEAIPWHVACPKAPPAPPPSLEYLLPAIDQRYPPSRSTEDWLRNRAVKFILRMAGRSEYQQGGLLMLRQHLRVAAGWSRNVHWLDDLSAPAVLFADDPLVTYVKPTHLKVPYPTLRLSLLQEAPANTVVGVDGGGVRQGGASRELGAAALGKAAARGAMEEAAPEVVVDAEAEEAVMRIIGRIKEPTSAPRSCSAHRAERAPAPQHQQPALPADPDLALVAPDGPSPTTAPLEATGEAAALPTQAVFAEPVDGLGEAASASSELAMGSEHVSIGADKAQEVVAAAEAAAARLAAATARALAAAGRISEQHQHQQQQQERESPYGAEPSNASLAQRVRHQLENRSTTALESRARDRQRASASTPHYSPPARVARPARPLGRSTTAAGSSPAAARGGQRAVAAVAAAAVQQADQVYPPAAGTHSWLKHRLVVLLAEHGGLHRGGNAADGGSGGRGATEAAAEAAVGGMEAPAAGGGKASLHMPLHMAETMLQIAWLEQSQHPHGGAKRVIQLTQVPQLVAADPRFSVVPYKSRSSFLSKGVSRGDELALDLEQLAAAAAGGVQPDPRPPWTAMDDGDSPPYTPEQVATVLLGLPLDRVRAMVDSCVQPALPTDPGTSAAAAAPAAGAAAAADVEGERHAALLGLLRQQAEPRSGEASGPPMTPGTGVCSNVELRQRLLAAGVWRVLVPLDGDDQQQGQGGAGVVAAVQAAVGEVTACGAAADGEPTPSGDAIGKDVEERAEGPLADAEVAGRSSSSGISSCSSSSDSSSGGGPGGAQGGASEPLQVEIVSHPDDPRLMALQDHVSCCSHIAVDCEMAANQLTLVQILAPAAGSHPRTAYLVDLEAAGSIQARLGLMRALAPRLTDPDTIKVLHSPYMDLLCMRRSYGIEMGPVLDTQQVYSVLMAAWTGAPYLGTRLLTLSSMGLDGMLEAMGVRHHHKALFKDIYRRDPMFWSRRPLTEAMVQYATQDVSHLLDAYRAMLRHLLDHPAAQPPFLMDPRRHKELQVVPPLRSMADPRRLEELSREAWLGLGSGVTAAALTVGLGAAEAETS